MSSNFTPPRRTGYLVPLAVLAAVYAAQPALTTAAAAQEVDYSHPAFKDIQREPSRGNSHVSGKVDYGTPYPTSGPHSARAAERGMHDEGDATPEEIVHALEHGNIVIYYDEPGEAAVKLLRKWTDTYKGALDGVIAIRRKGLGTQVVLTAWENRLELNGLDARATYFIDAFRGRGPEQRVR